MSSGYHLSYNSLHSPHNHDIQYTAPPLGWSSFATTPPNKSSPPPYHRWNTSSSTAMLIPSAPVEPRPVEKSNFFTRWMRWNTVAKPYTFWLLGTACAVAHGIFYKQLVGREANAQEILGRIGQVLAYLCRVFFSAAIVIAFDQQVWRAVRTRRMTVESLDSLFEADHHLTSFLDYKFWARSRSAAITALYLWLVPLVVIFTPSTLTVGPKEIAQSTSCPAARTLNFTKESEFRWRSSPHAVGDQTLLVATSFFNTTMPGQSDPDTDDDPQTFDYWTGYNYATEETAIISASSNATVPRRNVQAEVCGTSYNCTYNIQFRGPGYNCQELASGVDAPRRNLTQESGEAQAPFWVQDLLPQGNWSYVADTLAGEYANPQLPGLEIGGRPTTPGPLPQDFGAFRTEPVLWFGYSALNHRDQPVLLNRSDQALWADAFTPKILACELVEYDYVFEMSHVIPDKQMTRRLNRTYVGPVVNTTFLRGVDANDGTLDNTTATPHENYILPNDRATYQRVAAYHALGLPLRSLMNGSVIYQYSPAIVASKAMQVHLLDELRGYFTIENVQARVEEMYENTLLSMLSKPQFAAVVWAGNPRQQTGWNMPDEGPDNPANQFGYRCTRTHTTNVYFLQPTALFLPYTLAIVVALILLMASIPPSDARLRDTSFSSILAATQNAELHKPHWVAEADGPYPAFDVSVGPDVRQLCLGYGQVTGLNARGTAPASAPARATDSPPDLGGGATTVYAFGTADTVTQPLDHGYARPGRMARFLNRLMPGRFSNERHPSDPLPTPLGYFPAQRIPQSYPTAGGPAHFDYPSPPLHSGGFQPVSPWPSSTEPLRPQPSAAAFQ